MKGRFQNFVDGFIETGCVLCHNAQVQQKNVALHTPELIKQAVIEAARFFVRLDAGSAQELGDFVRELRRAGRTRRGVQRHTGECRFDGRHRGDLGRQAFRKDCLAQLRCGQGDGEFADD